MILKKLLKDVVKQVTDLYFKKKPNEEIKQLKIKQLKVKLLK